MYQKNELKNLIYIQENKPCNEQTINGLFRSIVEPVLEQNVEGLILLRLEDKSKQSYSGILKRLEFASAEVYDFSNNPICEKFKNILKDKIWNRTEFVYVLVERFGAVLIFDFEEEELENYAQIYTLYNSKNLSDVFDIINANSTKDLKNYDELWHPDRRDNLILNSSIRKVLENLNETNQEILITQIEKETIEKTEDVDLASRLEFLLAKSSYIAHEMRNLLSICNLYSTVIERQSHKVQFTDKEAEKSVLNAAECVKKALKTAGNLLLDFKSLRNTELTEHDLKMLVDSAIELSKVYANGKNIQFGNEIFQSANILVDENKFLTVLINLIKNAVESFEEDSEKKGYIVVNSKIEDENVKIIVSNNGTPIKYELQDKLFEAGFTTKMSGTGLGLAICKKTLEEQFAQLRLVKSDEVSTEFEITVLKG